MTRSSTASLGREHQDGHPALTLAKAAADLEPIEIGEPHIEDHDVVRVLRGEPQRILAGLRQVHRVPLLAKATLDQPTHADRVFHNEDPHAHLQQAS